jgi:hypothetical protein
LALDDKVLNVIPSKLWMRSTDVQFTRLILSHSTPPSQKQKSQLSLNASPQRLEQQQFRAAGQDGHSAKAPVKRIPPIAHSHEGATTGLAGGLGTAWVCGAAAFVWPGG